MDTREIIEVMAETPNPASFDYAAAVLVAQEAINLVPFIDEVQAAAPE